ncbi:MAG TPA: TolC family protein, partial [Paludibacteraceae bacterium]|nr:TolC family protein [Paludibacteraceae bacterium]
MRTPLLVIWLLFVSSILFGQQKWTLEQCLEHAKVENIQVQQRLIQAENAKINLQQSKQNLLPDLNMYVGQSFSFGRSIDETNTYQNNNVQNTNFSLSSSLNLYDGGRMFYAIEKSKLDFQALLLDVEQEKSTIELQVL